MKKLNFISWILILIFAVSACTSKPTQSSESNTPKPPINAIESATETVITPPTEADDVLYLNLVWHQHQPLYFKDENGVYSRPWVRVHATKDYYDMAAILQQYPNVKATFNLTPVLIKQLDDFTQNGAIDKYWQLSIIPAADLTIEEKTFILTRFFDANWDHIIARFPRYQELLDKRGGGDEESIQKALIIFDDQDYLDLQIWFNLAWFDPDFLSQEPLKQLVQKARNYSETDKTVLFAEVKKVMASIIPLHKEMQEQGQIEVITTPYAHPILPLIIDSNIASVGNPSTELPQKFSYPQDAIAQLQKSVEMYQEHYGTSPNGLWPGEGAVAQLMVPFVIKSGYHWMATGEPVLAKSLGINTFTRDAKETVKEADLLYRPYYVTNQEGDKLAVFFRDGVISDKIGFTYSGVSGEAAAGDFMQRMENIKAQLKMENAAGPHIVSVILDGENAWENYDNDGKDFFHALYRALNDSTSIKTITPSDYLQLFPEQNTIKDLFPGAWFSPNYDTWIGEPEENLAWEYLRKTREILAKYDVTKVRKTSPENLAKAQDFMHLAEGSDWFWWYGADQDSGQDDYFDEGYRTLLRKVFESLGEAVPAFVDTPIIETRPVVAEVAPDGLSSPTVDGRKSSDEWDKAGIYPGNGVDGSGTLLFTQDAQNLYFLVEDGAVTKVGTYSLYIKSPKANSGYPYSYSTDGKEVLLGSAMTHLLRLSKGVVTFYQATDEGWKEMESETAAMLGTDVIEFKIPLSTLGELETGDQIQFLLIDTEGNRVPQKGPGQLVIPDLGLSTLILEVEDPSGDDHGPGTYTYPTDVVFLSKAFDLKSFKISYDDNNIIFKVDLFGPIQNPWGSPNGLSIQTIDIYIDSDPGAGTGARKLLPGRNLSLSKEDGWEYALWLEGWTPQILTPDPITLDPLQVTDAEYKLIVDPAGRSISVRIPKSFFNSQDYENWGFAVVLLGQEGYPSTGVWRVRDVEPNNAQWRFGGAPNDSNHTRVIDLIWPANKTPTQEEMLSNYIGKSAAQDNLTADDYGIINLLRVK